MSLMFRLLMKGILIENNSRMESSYVSRMLIRTADTYLRTSTITSSLDSALIWSVAEIHLLRCRVRLLEGPTQRTCTAGAASQVDCYLDEAGYQKHAERHSRECFHCDVVNVNLS